MTPFRYFESEITSSAVALLTGQPQSKPLAGGTTLIDLMKQGVEHPAALVNINHLPLTEIEQIGSTIRIGALVRNSDLAEHPLIRERYPMLSEALLSGASPQLRNMATVGGNLMQRTRCAYFREPELPCNKRHPGSGCGAIPGLHRMHAILGVSESCIATHASDMCVPLAALDAIVRIEGLNGTREIPLTDFHLLPAGTPERETVLTPGELITAVDIPDLPFARGSHYLKVRDRASYEFALSSAAVALDINGGVIRNARLALGGVGTKPWRCLESEQVLQGQKPGIEAYTKAADLALVRAEPHHDNLFKVELTRQTIIRALSQTEQMHES